MTNLHKIRDRKNAATFLSFILFDYEKLGMGAIAEEYIPPFLHDEYKARHKHILEGLNHLLNYLKEEEN